MGEARRVRDAIHQVDSETAIDQVMTLQQVLDDSVASPRLTAGLLGPSLRATSIDPILTLWRE